jgi:hypothetical protein
LLRREVGDQVSDEITGIAAPQFPLALNGLQMKALGVSAGAGGARRPLISGNPSEPKDEFVKVQL